MIKRNLSGDEGGNDSNIYKHEIYISVATAACLMMLYVYGDSLGLTWRYVEKRGSFYANMAVTS